MKFNILSFQIKRFIQITITDQRFPKELYTDPRSQKIIWKNLSENQYLECS